MKSWINRFALMAVVGSVLCSALVMGCGGGGEEDSAAPANATKSGGTDKDGADTP